MKNGTQLYTRDGRKCGNAIILREYNQEKYNYKGYVVKTDFGHVMKLTETEIKQFFYDPEESETYSKESVLGWMWAKARLFFEGLI